MSNRVRNRATVEYDGGMPFRRFLLLVLLTWCAAGYAAAFGPTAKVTAELDATALAPGKPARLAIVVDIPPGTHAQSHTPSADNFIACEVKLSDPPPGVTFGEPIYPPGKSKLFPSLGLLNIYDGRTIITVPLKVSANVAAGPAKLAGKVGLQICDDRTCYPPASVPFSLNTSIVSDPATIQPANHSLFPVEAAPTTEPAPATSPSAAEPAPPTTQAAAPLTYSLLGFSGAIDSTPAAFVAAIVAGLLFNIMPCVLPVLPLKAIGFYEASQHNRGRSLGFGVAFSVGVIAIFGAMALLVVFSRSLFGTQVSWGQQFSNPIFVAGVVVILLLLGAAMLGAFALNLPSSIYGLSFRHDTVTGNVMWGGLTAILSTPCTAPLFPLVLAAAMTKSSTLVAVAIVLAVGMGMALPYLVLSAFPELARRFPRTGPFSEIFRQMLAFPIFGTAAFFGGSLFGSEGLQTMLIFGVAVAAGVFVLMRTRELFNARARPMAISGLVAILVVGGTLWFVLPSANATAATTDGVQWTDYSPEKLKQSLAEGRPVLVKFTAKWCANCIVLDNTVYRQASVIAALRDRRVVAMHLDVDKSGWDLLNSLAPGAGIPFTALYVPNRPQPLVLASMHDSNALLDLLRQSDPAVAAQR